MVHHGHLLRAGLPVKSKLTILNTLIITSFVASLHLNKHLQQLLRSF